MTIFRACTEEFSDDDPSKTASKLKRKLSRLKLPYNQSQIDCVRALHTQLRDEISKLQGSKYYRSKTREFAAPENFDADAMVEDYKNLYPQIDTNDLEKIIGFSVYLYYMR